MSEDLIERLREGRTTGTDLRWTVTPEHLEAAAEIERLRAKLAEAEKVIAPFAERANWRSAEAPEYAVGDQDYVPIMRPYLRAAAEWMEKGDE